MSTYRKYRNFQCPSCCYNNSDFHKCMVWARYVFDGIPFRGGALIKCRDYKKVR